MSCDAEVDYELFLYQPFSLKTIMEIGEILKRDRAGTKTRPVSYKINFTGSFSYLLVI
jgi:hypothetical protein